MKLSTSSVVVAAALTAAAPAIAAPDVVTSFDEATLDKIMTAVVATEIEKTTVGTDPARFFTVDGLKYTAALRGCTNGAKCPAVLVQCIFDGETFATTTTNKFNLSQTFAVSAVSDDRKSLFLGRLTVALGGTTVENAVETFKVFFTMPAMLREQVLKESPAPIASATPGATPVASATTPAVAAAPSAGISAGATTAANFWVVEGARANPVKR